MQRFAEIARHQQLATNNRGQTPQDITNLTADAGELDNLASIPRYRAQLEIMEQELIAAMQTVDDNGKRISDALESRHIQ